MSLQTNKKRISVTCKICKMVFTIPFWRSKTQTLCSKACNGTRQKINSILKNGRNCKQCCSFFVKSSSSKGLFCSHSCYSKSKNIYGVMPNCKDCNKQLTSHKSILCKVCLGKSRIGNNHPLWIKDRTLLKDDHRDRGGQLHREWSNKVKDRDKVCRTADINCGGRLEAHHILGWTKYPELRYDIKNGITLCHAHHPRKRSEEAKLSPYFQKLVAEMN
jgi:hypothetical protein